MREIEAVLVIADISGYTRFIVMYRTSVIHAEQNISALLEEVTNNASFPLTVQKLEGDTVFLSAEATDATANVVNDMVRQITVFLTTFHAKQKNRSMPVLESANAVPASRLKTSS